MSEPDARYILAAITPIVEAFEQLGVNYHIGGSVARWWPTSNVGQTF
jgi:hypothetical protein